MTDVTIPFVFGMTRAQDVYGVVRGSRHVRPTDHTRCRSEQDDPAVVADRRPRTFRRPESCEYLPVHRAVVACG
ncbi:hypothetical protein Rrhod_3973 [Rhodococcus rhodnii LMG 5362]|uniref:Uncharacterized protein n=1 Tax=Rhodococcus rhodnii LMG 5362 TaxID=1273125 RepID=R7WHT8_9NOCA|nr:hypothetical protein Rrhod_3973 [Rhodococcus rhodnii LMG 5362]